LGFPNWPVIYFITTAPSIAIKVIIGTPPPQHQLHHSHTNITSPASS
jgi:hypothetical protein